LEVEYQETYDAMQAMAYQGTLAGATLLDVGAGNGAFERRVSPTLLQKEYCLPRILRSGEKIIENYGISCLSQDIRMLDLETNAPKFDIVCMFQVLEHLITWIRFLNV